MPNALSLINGEITEQLFNGGSVDIFGNTVVSERINQIEVPLNDTNWLDFVDVSNTSTGNFVQSNGQLTFSTGTSATGSYIAKSKDSVKYRAGSEIGWGFTFRFPSAGVANSYQRIGCTGNTNWFDGVWVGYEGTTFGVTYSREGSIVFTKQKSQWLDPCDGSSTSLFTKDGNPVAIDVTKDQLIRIRAALFGHAGFIVEIRTPDGAWLTIVEYSAINTDTVPVFSDFDLKVAAEVKKTSGSNNLSVVSACWAGWTGVSLNRMSDPVTDRTLAQTGKTVIVGKSTAQGGIYVPVKVNPSGALTADVSGSIVGTTDSTDIEYTSVATSVLASGDTIVYTPAIGKRIRLHWIYAINDPNSNTSTKITIRLGSQVLYVAWAISKRQQFTGAINAPLVINLSNPGDIALTAFLEEVN